MRYFYVDLNGSFQTIEPSLLNRVGGGGAGEIQPERFLQSHLLSQVVHRNPE
jgi:hypothetical protein